MSERERIDPTPGLAGGPQPSPPGVSDGTRAVPREDDEPAAPRRTDGDTPAPTPGHELDGDGMLTPRETGTPGGVPGRS